MQPMTSSTPISYSALPIVSTSRICEHVAASGSAPIVRVRSVNQDFFQASRIPLANAVIMELKAVISKNFPDPKARLGAFKKYLSYVQSTNGLPDRFRYAALKELCRIVNTLPNDYLAGGWQDIAAQFNAEPEAMRLALRADMNKVKARLDFYGDGGIKFEFKTVAEALLEVLKAADYKKFPKEEDRLLSFRRGLHCVKTATGLPDQLREAILKELCRIVNTLPNTFFHAGWRDMVAQFNAESEVMRTALKPDMNKAWERVELYGDGGTPFHFDKPLQRGS
ncbi:hypothetical protein KTQ42_10525|uniref:hypothetical protein n=1 Tax=Noviherbaspirillum sp. L7-7A TaxID=2850560 RepID=UPI001C2C95B0|nr:hypothetical protein [Noviherbaspirillum sp. L7-7A]MBV0879736.1 hypothetical protein [Noviherbaspirillum sp. L7-7A]